MTARTLTPPPAAPTLADVASTLEFAYELLEKSWKFIETLETPGKGWIFETKYDTKKAWADLSMALLHLKVNDIHPAPVTPPPAPEPGEPVPEREETLHFAAGGKVTRWNVGTQTWDAYPVPPAPEQSARERAREIRNS